MKLQSCVFPALAVLVLSFGGERCRAAVGDENWDGSFGVPGANGGVLGMHLVGSKVYACGNFSSIGGVAATNYAKWNGGFWSSVDDPSGCGCLTVPSQINCSQLALGLNGGIGAIAVIGSNVYVGGNFTTAGGLPALRIAKWGGGSWSRIGDVTNATPGCADGCYDDGMVFALQARGNDLYVGGRFTYAGNVFANNVARWDGTNWSALGPGLDDQVTTLAVTDSDVYAAGNFRHAGNLTVNMIARWDGTNWHDLAGGVSDLFGSVNAFAVNGSDLYVAGSFRQVGGIAASRIAKWSGQSWSLLGSGIGGGFGSGVGPLASTGSELYVGGYFPSAGGIQSANIALWHIPHPLTITRFASGVSLSWPATGTNLVLESLDTFGQTNWAEVPQPFSIVNDQCVVTNGISASNRFYRLRRR